MVIETSHFKIASQLLSLRLVCRPIYPIGISKTELAQATKSTIHVIELSPQPLDSLRWPEERMRLLAHRMLSRFPSVRRWDETDDILQESALRLHRALQTTTPESELHLHRLAVLQIRRVLIDLARHYANESSFAAHHDTGHGAFFEQRDAIHAAHPEDEPDHLETWTRLHEAADGLPEHLKEVFDLRWYEGLNPDEAVELLVIPKRTIERRYREAKRWISRQLNGEMPALGQR